jgi:hypothetical protein
MTAGHHDLIFMHQGNASVSASIVLTGMLAVLIGGVFMAIGPQLKTEPRNQLNAGSAAPTPMRFIGAAPRTAVPCDQQVWPKIEQSCLVRTNTAPAKPENAPAAAKRAKIAPPVQENAKLSPQEDTTVLHEPASSESVAAKATVDMGDRNEVDELPLPAEPPRRHVHRHFGLPFQIRIGAFRF